MNQNDDVILIDENETNQNEMNIGKYVERTKNGNVQTKNNKVKKKWGTNNEFFFGKAIIKMLYVGHFIPWMTRKRLKE